MATSPDLDAAKDRLVDSLSSARDVTVTAVREDIAPAVVAAVGAAREASGPVIAEAASRTSDAAKAVRDNETVAKTLRKQGKAVRKQGKAVRKQADALRHQGAARLDRPAKRGKRLPFLLAALGAGGAAFSLAKRRKAAAATPAKHYPAAVPSDEAATAPVTDGDSTGATD
jgi:hypothetical protein